MVEHLEPEKQQLDDQLVEFTDRLLAGETTEEVPMDALNTELSTYQRTLLRLKHTAGESTPTSALREKIWARHLTHHPRGPCHGREGKSCLSVLNVGQQFT